jgi:hypothetical protein
MGKASGCKTRMMIPAVHPNDRFPGTKKLNLPLQDLPENFLALDGTQCQSRRSQWLGDEKTS